MSEVKPLLNLRFDFESLIRIKEEANINLVDGSLKASEYLNPINLVSLIWGGLLHEDETLTIPQVRTKIKRLPAKEVVKCLNEALKRDLQDEAKPDAAPSDTPSIAPVASAG